MNSLSAKRVSVRFFGHVGHLLAVIALLVGVAGCVAVKPRAAEEVVKERSQARWDALVKGDVKAAYEFFSPGSRATLTFESYANSIRAGFWKSAVVDRVVCESQDACEAHATIEYEFRAQRIKTPLRETWIREGTDWWYVKRS